VPFARIPPIHVNDIADYVAETFFLDLEFKVFEKLI